MFRSTFPVGTLQCNCTILGDENTREAVVIDPGDEVDRILLVLTEHKLKAVAIIHTHAHIDHIGGTAELARITQAPTYLHQDDRFLHDMLAVQAQMLGFPKPASGPIDQPLPDEHVINFGQHEIGVIHTPGHTPGSVCFHLPKHDICFSGDTLFASGIGRTDLWGGDAHAIVQSIRHRLYTLNGAVEVIPGHGPATSIDREKTSNPFA